MAAKNPEGNWPSPEQFGAKKKGIDGQSAVYDPEQFSNPTLNPGPLPDTPQGQFSSDFARAPMGATAPAGGDGAASTSGTQEVPFVGIDYRMNAEPHWIDPATGKLVDRSPYAVPEKKPNY